MLTTVTLLLGAILVTMYYFNKFKAMELSITIKFYWFLYNHVTSYACGVTFAYWTLYYKGEPIDLNNVLVHMFNTIIIFDNLIVRHPAKYWNFFHSIAFGIIYVFCTVAYQMLGGLDQ